MRRLWARLVAVCTVPLTSRDDDEWIRLLQAMNRDESWEGLRHRAGRLVDARGRFAKPNDIHCDTTRMENAS